MAREHSLAFFAACSLMLGCGTQGTVAVTVYGESLIEEGIPADAVSDGWSIEFTRFAVALRDVLVAGHDVPVPGILDLTLPTAGAGQPLGEITADEGDSLDVAFTIDRIEVEGSAQKDGVEKAFEWVIEDPIRYDQCEGVGAVSAGETLPIQITIHGDHLFYDSLVAAEPNVVFQPFADADLNANGEIEIDGELWEADIGAFDPGNQPAPSLWVWTILAARSIGHVNGEHHCRSTSLAM